MLSALGPLLWFGAKLLAIGLIVRWVKHVLVSLFKTR